MARAPLTACGPRPGPRRSSWTESVETGNQPPGPRAKSLVGLAELRAQQGFFRADACDQRRNEQDRDRDSDTGAECQAPTERVGDQSQVTGMPNHRVNAGRDKFVSGLDRDQSAEAMTEYED